MIENFRNNETTEEQITKQLKVLLRSAYSGPKKFENHEKITEFAQKLQREYPEEFSNYLLYHLVANSTPNKQNPPALFDFPGENSVQKFIEELD